MANVNISTLFQGIANSQPPQRRNPGQLEDAENVHFDVLDGSRKRNPFLLAAAIDPDISGNNINVITVQDARIIISRQYCFCFYPRRRRNTSHRQFKY